MTALSELRENQFLGFEPAVEAARTRSLLHFGREHYLVLLTVLMPRLFVSGQYFVREVSNAEFEYGWGALLDDGEYDGLGLDSMAVGAVAPRRSTRRCLNGEWW